MQHCSHETASFIVRALTDKARSVQRNRERMAIDLIRTSFYDRHSGSMKISTHLDRISHCEKKASGTNKSNGWTYRVSNIKARRN